MVPQNYNKFKTPRRWVRITFKKTVKNVLFRILTIKRKHTKALVHVANFKQLYDFTIYMPYRCISLDKLRYILSCLFNFKKSHDFCLLTSFLVLTCRSCKKFNLKGCVFKIPEDFLVARLVTSGLLKKNLSF